MFEDETIKTPTQLPIDLEILSINELEERIMHLKEAIAACETAILKKKSSLTAANALFGKTD